MLVNLSYIFLKSVFSILATVSPVVMETRTVVKDGGQEGDETVNRNQVYIVRLKLKHK